MQSISSVVTSHTPRPVQRALSPAVSHQHPRTVGEGGAGQGAVGRLVGWLCWCGSHAMLSCNPTRRGRVWVITDRSLCLGVVKKMACWVEPRAASCRPCVQASLAMSLSEGGCLRCCSRRAGKDKQTVAFLYWGHVRSDSGADA